MGLLGWLSRLFGTSSTNGDKPATSTVDSDDHQSTTEPGDAESDGEKTSPKEWSADLVESAEQAGYDLDYSPQSLTTLDTYLAELSPREREAYARSFVAYLGEVFVQHYEGEWTFVEEIGWIVDLSAVTADEEEGLFSVPHATQAVMEGDMTFAQVHDETMAGLSVSGPTLADEPIPDRAGPASEPLDEAAQESYREQADELVSEWPAYDLDYTPASLVRLDDLIADNYDTSSDDVDRAARASETPPGVVPEGATLQLGTGGATTQIAAYVGEVFRREYDAEWRAGDSFDTIVVEVDAGQLEFEPERLVSAAFPGYVSFERLHESFVQQQGLATESG